MGKPEAEPRTPEAEATEKPRLFEPFQQPDGQYAVLFPSAFKVEREAYVGVQQQAFDTVEEATEAAIKIRDFTNEQFDRAGFDRAYETADLVPLDHGGFIVLEEHDGARVAKPFESWREAADYYAEQQPDAPASEQIVRLELEDTALTFTPFTEFDPSVPARREALPVPEALRGYLDTREREAREGRDTGTYQETIKRPHWQSEIFMFVEQQLDGGLGDLRTKLGIDDLRAVTPRQAAELATSLALELHRYSKDAEAGGKAADSKDALTLLKEGARHRDDPDWEGNGVCRNVASTVKAVFESLKVNQVRYSRLNDVYCSIESGRGADFNPGVQHEALDGHAWNSFITVHRDGKSSQTLADATWGRRDLDTGEIINVDQTATRIEPFIYDRATAPLWRSSADREKGLEAAQTAIDYYSGRLSELDGRPDGTSKQDALAFYSNRALTIINGYKLTEVPDGMVAPMLVGFDERLRNVATGRNDLRRNLEALWGLKDQINGPSVVDYYVGIRLKKDGFSGNAEEAYVVSDEALQREISRSLRTNLSPEQYEKQLATMPKLQRRIDQLG